jgi:hypothetical protein
MNRMKTLHTCAVTIEHSMFIYFARKIPQITEIKVKRLHTPNLLF